MKNLLVQELDKVIQELKDTIEKQDLEIKQLKLQVNQLISASVQNLEKQRIVRILYHNKN